MILLVVLVLLGLVGPAMMYQNASIIGGVEALPGEFPYVISLIDVRFGTRIHFCGGAVYKNHWAITAAHCVHTFEASDIQVVAGEHDRSRDEGFEQYGKVASITKHPHYNANTMNNDIALLKLVKALQFDDYVQPVTLAEKTDPLPQEFTLVGWGSNTEDGDPVNVLHKVTVPRWNEADCLDALKDHYYSPGKETICAGSEQGDGCLGDDGGPLVTGNKAFGLASWSVGCGRPNTPAVYTALSDYIAWIEEATN
ncbi:trypsin-1-like [Macrobrachium nipponense]|uniref:trypsin-1-like n=1 Tax=Macrobrachium nipponense TaxID=159736 RepID=UPI0030C82327